LVKPDGSALSKVILGLGWDQASGGGEIDLDASAILFDSNRKALDTVWYGSLSSKDGSVRHSGDNLTGNGDGDDEQIVVDLSAVSPQVQGIVLVITSYSGQKFDKVKNVFARVLDASTGANTEVVRYNLADGGSTAKIVAKLVRDGSGWTFAAVGNDANGRTVKNVIKDAALVL
jgi:tellurium resistance protein TerZ